MLARCYGASWVTAPASNLQGGTVTVFKSRLTCRLVSSAAIAFAIGLAPLAAFAQTSPDRIDAIERHIRQLEGELQALQRELGATRQQLRQSRRGTAHARAKAEPTARVAGGPQLRPDRGGAASASAANGREQPAGSG